MRSRLVLLSALVAAPFLSSTFTQAGTLAKLTIQPEKGDSIVVMFNPREYTITKATPWKHHDIQGLDAVEKEFTSGEPYRVQTEQTQPRARHAQVLADQLGRFLSQPGDPFPPLLALHWNKEVWVAPLFAVDTRPVAPGTPDRGAVLRALWGEMTEVVRDESAEVPSVPVVVRSADVEVRAGLAPVELTVFTVPDGVGFTEALRVPQLEPGGFDTKSLPVGPQHHLVATLVFDRLAERGDVRLLTNDVRSLLAVGADGLRPLAQLELPGPRFVNGYLESFNLRFTLFLDDGTPVRAVMNTVWKEFSPAEEQLRSNPRH